MGYKLSVYTYAEQRTISHPNVDCNLQLRNLTYASIKSYTKGIYLECAKRTPKSRRRADPNWTQSGPRADSEQTPSEPKFLKSGLKADPKRTPGLLSGSALVLGWVRSILYAQNTQQLRPQIFVRNYP